MLTLLFLGSCNVRAESDNPFGFETQTHPLQYEYCKKEETDFLHEPFLHECQSAPRMHPDIKTIYLKFVEGVGLCFIRANSGDFIGFGKELGGLIDSFKDQIANKYGSPTSELKEIDPEKEETVFGGKEYRYEWNPNEGFSGLGAVASISVKRLLGMAIIFFELETSEACQKKEDELRNRAF